jgi:hypothetical protein
MVLVLSLSLLSYPDLVANWRECLAAPGCTCTPQGLAVEVETTALKTKIADSAGYFLLSHSNFQSFLNRVEMSELNKVDNNELRAFINRAVDNMKKAKATYIKVKKTAKKIPFNNILIERLQAFDFDRFQSQYGLLSPIYDRVKTKLSKGDIAGLDDGVIFNMGRILNQLNQVKAVVDKGQLPDIQVLWRIFQSYVEAQLYGQYISEIIKANI